MTKEIRDRIFKRLQRILSDETNHEAEEISLNLSLEQDLNIILDDSLKQIITKINEEFKNEGVELDYQIVLNEFDVVGDSVEVLVNLVEEEQVFG
jgi:uncharacterized protein YpuA (DUF1002 family)